MITSTQQTLDPQLKQFLDALAKLPEAPFSYGEAVVAEGRRQYLQFALLHAGRPLSMRRVEDITIPCSDGYALPLRIYTPTLEEKLPVMLYIHGGGWQRGSIATHDSICRHLANDAGCAIVSVDWRLAPEHKFPMGLHDVLTAYQWIVANSTTWNMDANSIAIGGDSAGGNLAAALVQMIAKLPMQQPVFQLLLYPSLDFSCSSASFTAYADGYFLTAQRVRYYIDGYIQQEEDKQKPMCAPLMATDFTGLPKTHIVTCGFDPLRDDGEIYAKKLEGAGIHVTYRCYETMIHACLHMNETVPAVKDALHEIAFALKEGLQSAPNPHSQHRL